MNKFFKQLYERYMQRSQNRKQANIDHQVNYEVVIRNDKNDPSNKVYIFVAGVPVIQLDKMDKTTEQFFANIKAMYRNKLMELPISQQ